MSEQPDSGDDSPLIAGVYVETSRYRRLLGLEREARAVIDALVHVERPEQISEALQLAIRDAQKGPESESWSADAQQSDLYQALTALMETIDWKPSS